MKKYLSKPFMFILLIVFVLILSSFPPGAFPALAAPDDKQTTTDLPESSSSPTPFPIPTSESTISPALTTSPVAGDTQSNTIDSINSSTQGKAVSLQSLVDGNGYFTDQGLESLQILPCDPEKYTEDVDNGDGTRSLKLYNKPIKYKDSNGEYKYIDNSIISFSEKSNEHQYKNSASDIQILMSDDLNQSSAIEMDYQGYSIGFMPLGIIKDKAEVNFLQAGDIDNKDTSFDKSAKYDSIEYSGTFDNNTDIKIIPDSDGVKEDIVLKEVPSVTEFSYELSVKGVAPLLRQDGNLYFVDLSKGMIVAAIPIPTMYDSSPEPEKQVVAVSLEKTGDNTYRYMLIPDQQFLQNATYPVVIDPSVNTPTGGILDTYVRDTNPADNFDTLSYLSVGHSNTGNTYRGIIQINSTGLTALHNSIPQGAVISEVRYYAYQIYNNSSTANFEAHAITSSFNILTVSWSTQPSFDSTIIYTRTVTTYNNWYWWNITSLGLDWYYNTTSHYGKTTYGLLLKNNNEATSSYKEFSSDTASSNKCYLQYIYTPDTTAPSAPTSVTTNPVAITSWVNNAIPVLSWSGITDTGGSGLAKAQYKINSSTWTDIPTGSGIASGSYTLPSGALSSSGTHTISVRGVDGAGNLGSTNSVTYKLDITSPVSPTISTTPVATTTWTNDSTPVLNWSNSTDAHSGMNKLQYKVGTAGTWTDIPSSTGATGTYNLPTLTTSGTYTYYVRGVDNVGKLSTEISVVYKYDGTPPTTPTISTTPAATTTWTTDSTPVLNWSNSTDAHSGMNKLQYKIGTAGTWTDIPSSTGATGTFNLPALTTSGTYTFFLHGIDNVGLAGSDASVVYKLDFIKPVPTITSPKGSSIVSGTVPIMGTVMDDVSGSGISSWQLEYGLGINPATWTQIASGTSAVSTEATLGSLDTSSLIEGALYTIRLAATDAAGNTDSTSIQLIKDTAARLGMKSYWGYSAFSTGNGNGNINVSSGNLVYQSTDFSFPSLIPMSMARTYNSQSRLETSLGEGWDCSFNIKLYSLLNGDMVLKEGDGTLYRFTHNPDDSYTPENGVFMTLEYLPTDLWRITRKDNIKYLFYGDGRMERIYDLNGNYLEYEYNGQGNVSTITSSANEAVTCEYYTAADNNGLWTGLLKSVTDPAGRVFNYTYNSSRQFINRSFALTETTNWTEQFAYNLGKVSSITDGNGNQTALTYSGNRITRVTYPITSLYMTYSYNDTNHTMTAANQLSQSTVYTYDTNGLVTRTTDPLWTSDTYGHYMNYTYDSTKYLVTATSATQYNSVDNTSTTVEWSYSYDANGNPTLSIDPLGHRTVYEYNSLNEVTYQRVKGTDNVTDYAVTSYQYDSNGNLIATFEPNLNKTTYTYNGYGLVITESTFPYYSSVQGGYLSTPSTSVTYSYDQIHHWLNQTTKPSGLTTKILQFDGMGNSLYIKDEQGKISKMVYDLLGRTLKDYQAMEDVSESNPASADWSSDPVETTTYDLNGNVMSSISDTELETDYVYDSFDRLTTTTTDPNGNNAVSTVAYGFNLDNYYIETSTDISTGITTVDYYNALGQKIKTESSGSTTTYNYDSVGNQIVSTKSVEGNATVYETINKYDKLNRVTDTYQDATISNIHSTMTYDLLGNVTGENDGQGSVTESTYDTSGRLLSDALTKDGNEYNTIYSYYAVDESGNTYDAVTDNNGSEETYTNGDGDIVKEIDILAGGTTFTTIYDYTGSPTNVYVGSANERQLAEITYTNTQDSENVLFQMPGSQQRSVAYSSRAFTGTLRYENDQVDRFIYTYDKFGNIINVKDNINSLETRYSYDSANRISSVNEGAVGFTNPTHSYTVTYSSGKISSISETINSQTSSIDFSYGDNNLINSANFNYGSSNTSKTTWSYDSYSRVTAHNVYDDNTNQIFSTTTGYTENSNLTSYISSIENKQIGQDGYDKTITYGYNNNAIKSITSISDGTNSTTYAYDERERLVRENNQAAGKTWTWEYYLDGTTHGGNIHYKREYAYTTNSDPGIPLTTIIYSYNDSQGWTDLLTSYNGNTITYYAGSGNPENDGTWTYNWEAGHNLVGLSKTGTSVSFTYNQDGIRTSKTVNGVTTKYTLANGRVTSEVTGTDVIFFRYDCDGKPISMEIGGIEYYYFIDAQNNVVGMFDHDGNVIVQYAYDAWGKLISVKDGSGNDKMSDSSFIGNINPYRYRGYWYDTYDYSTGFGLYYLQSRYYNPVWERFINADTVDYAGENMFNYGNNNPMTNIDRDGHEYITIRPDLFKINGVFYGGDQAWYDNSIRQSTGCGPVAAANIMCYTALTFKSMAKLYDFNLKKITKDDFRKYMNAVYQCVKPNALLGSWDLSNIEKFAAQRRVKLKCYKMNIAKSKDILHKESLAPIVKYIKLALKGNHPVALLIGFNSKCEYQTHWITITNIRDDMSSATRRITVGLSTWGTYRRMDFIKYYQGIKEGITLVDKMENFR